jgi:serine/threonine-protein kinase
LDRCPSCGADTAADEEVCFKCGRGLSGITEGCVVGSRYEILSRVGRGGMGVVYRARDRELDEIVALKVLRADLASADLAGRFRSEIKLARRVTHRNVCRIHEFGRDSNVAFIVMEYLDGVDFKRILQGTGPLPPGEAYDVAIQVLKGLQEIHASGIVHRDLKTANIMRDSRGVVKLMDFGIAKSLESGTTGTTVTGHVVGTPEYMSPEQARADKVDVRSDIYAVGIVTFELFTADVPFRGDTPVAVLFKHIQDPPPLEGKGVPTALVPVLRKALAKAPEERFQSAAAFIEALDLARAQLPALANRAPTPIQGTTPARLAQPQPETTPIPTPVPALIPTPVSIAVRDPIPAPARAPLASRPSRAGLTGWVGIAAGAAVLAAGAGFFLLALAQHPAAGVATSGARSASAGPRWGTGPPTSMSALTGQPQPTATAPAVLRLLPSALPTAKALAGPQPSVAPTQPFTSPATPKPEPQIFVATPSSGVRAAPAEPAPALVAAAPTPVENGVLRLSVVPWADVIVDGKQVGATPLKPISLSAGVHALVLSNPGFQPLNKKVTIEPGTTRTLEVDLTFEAFPK